MPSRSQADTRELLRVQAELAIIYEGALRKSLLELLRLVADAAAETAKSDDFQRQVEDVDRALFGPVESDHA